MKSAYESTPGLKLSLAGVPVVVRPFFFLIAILFTMSDREHPEIGLAWSAVLFVSVLVHELGHAMAMRLVGIREPWIEIGAFGGAAHWNEEVRVGPAARLFVSLAGPGIELVLATGLFVLGLYLGFSFRDLLGASLFGPLPSPPTRFDAWHGAVLSLVFGFALRINVAWALVNLLPVVPLDGGNALADFVELVTGRSGARVARVATVLVGSLACALAVYVGMTFAAILFGASAFRAFQELRGAAPASDRSRAEFARAGLALARQAFLEERYAEADRLAVRVLERNPPRAEADEAHRLRAWVALRLDDVAAAEAHASNIAKPTDLALLGVLALERGRVDESVSLLERAYEATRDRDAAIALARALYAQGGSPRLRAWLETGSGRDLEAPAFAAIVLDALAAEVFDEAAELGAMLHARYRRPVDAFLVARATARLGRLEDAMTWLERARTYVDVRPSDLDHADLASLRGTPAFAAFRASLAGGRQAALADG